MNELVVKGASHLSFYSKENMSEKFISEVSAIQDLLKEKIDKEKNIETKNELKNILEASKPKSLNNFINLDHGIFSLTPHELFFIRNSEKSLWVDFLLHRYRFKKYPTSRKVSSFPVHVCIEPTAICNLRCVMCFQVDKSFSQNKEYIGYMDMGLFNKVVDEISKNNCKAVTLASRGEPTLHKQFDIMLDKLHEKNIFDVKINTNATMLTDKLIHSILKNKVAVVVFSVDACNKETYERIRVKGKFERVLKNIQRFNEIRKSDYPNSITQTRISGVAVENTQNPIEMRDYWEKYVDQVSIRREIPRWDSYGNKIHNKEGICNLLYERLYVWFDGTCVPCDYDYKSYLNLGNANNNTIKEIWHGEKYNEIRKIHTSQTRKCLEPCNRCNFGID